MFSEKKNTFLKMCHFEFSIEVLNLGLVPMLALGWIDMTLVRLDIPYVGTPWSLGMDSPKEGEKRWGRLHTWRWKRRE